MSKVLATPGVYIEEKSAFPSSVVAVPTAIPAFVGFTSKAMRGKKSLKNIPTRIGSYAEFLSFFGEAPKTTYTITPDEEKDYVIEADSGTEFYLYNSIRLFYSNGGGPCYIVSVGKYEDGVGSEALLEGIELLRKEQEPTMLVIPDAVLLEKDDCFTVQKTMLMHCGTMQDRMAVLDVYNGYEERTFDDEDVITSFREGVGNNFLAFGAAYYPWVHTTITSAAELNYTNISNIDGLQGVIEKEVAENLEAGVIKEERASQIREEIAKLADADADITSVSNTLLAVSPIFKSVLGDLRKALNVLPASAAMAGVYSLVDNSVGVHKSPANVGLNNVVAPAVNITSDNQEDLNLPLNGKAINAIRGFVGKGVLVWGARTLDGNSQDWRYINVRRTMIMIEQSIKIACEAYVFEPNTANTWVSVRSMITNFLTSTWKKGALAGTAPSDAFSVDIGLGATMTPNDILDGVMNVTVKVAITRPAEFIVLTFQQQMQKS